MQRWKGDDKEEGKVQFNGFIDDRCHQLGIGAVLVLDRDL